MKQLRLEDQGGPAETSGGVTGSRRVPLERKVVLKFHHFGGFFIEYSSNISLSGMFIKTAQPKPPGSIFIFEIWLGDEHKLVHGVGEVVWTRTEDQGGARPSGMGIQFLKIDDESRGVIERVIAEQVLKGGTVFDISSATPGEVAESARRANLELVEPLSVPITEEDLLVLDEELLGFEAALGDPIATTELQVETHRPGRGLQYALLLIVLAAVMGGAAYLFSADLFPF